MTSRKSLSPHSEAAVSELKRDKIFYLKTGIGLVFGAIAVLAMVFGAYHGLNWYIDYRIDNKISHPEFRSSVARSIRPSVIFNENNSILADMGAMAFIDNINVDKHDRGLITITVTPKKFIAVPPVLECLDALVEIAEIKRGTKYDLVYELKEVDFLVMSSPGNIKNVRFRLELLR